MHAIWNGDATVVRQERYSPNCWKMTVHVPSSEPIEAGQFCHILTDFASEPLATGIKVKPGRGLRCGDNIRGNRVKQLSACQVM